MMRGWFDLFRENGGPTMYSHSNRTAVIGDITTVTLLTVFITLYIAFFVIFPGIRQERFTTFLSVTLSMFVGSSILLSNNGSSWHKGETEIASAYKAFSNEKIMGNLGVYIGLKSVNITLDAMSIYYNTSMDIHFNERFQWIGPTDLKEDYRSALEKGLPFPILTVAEYLSLDAEGFCWGRTYRKAGYYTSICLWFALVMWLCMNMLIIVVPRYGAYLMTATGLMMMFSNFIYFWLIPIRPLIIHLDQVIITFEYGWCFWLTLIAGCICSFVGGTISLIDLMYPHKFSTILEMNYGTPFDRHIIIEDSHETKTKKKTAPKQEEPATLGFGGLLRKLSKRDHGRHMDQHPGGHGNYAFEMETPKSPWRYPHFMFRSDSRKSKSISFKDLGDGFNHSIPAHLLRRTDSKDSSCSSSLGSIIHHGIDMRKMSDMSLQKQFRRTDSSESSNSSLASFAGLGSILNRSGNNNKRPVHRVVTMNHNNPSMERSMMGSPVSSADEGNTGAPLSATPSSSSSNNEVAVIVSSRKNSTTNAVRRNSADQQRNEASMW